jgi:RNA polymerase sigma-70 factor (ECF subfamily)
MSLQDLPDEQLVAAHRQASGPARTLILDELFGRHYERVARWCLRFTGDRDAAADLAQDVFVKASRYIDGFKGTARFTTWLYAIVRNESLNRLQRAGPPMEDDEVLQQVAAIDPGPDVLAEQESRSRRLHAFLAETLEETERAVFTLHYGDGMALDAITRLLQLQNASGAKAFIVSAKRKLARATERLRARGDQM